MSEIAIKHDGIFMEKRGRKAKTRGKSSAIEPEALEIIEALEGLQKELNLLYSQFNFMTDPALIDGCIYDIKAANAKYTFYLNRCKEKRIKAV